MLRLADVACPVSSKQAQDVPVSLPLCLGAHIRHFECYAAIVALVTCGVMSMMLLKRLPAGDFDSASLPGH